MIVMKWRAALGAMALALVCGGAAAADYPAKPVRFITANSAGSGADIMTRRLGERLATELGEAFVVENLPGAGGVMGSQTLKDAPADGYTIGLISTNYVVFPHLYKNLRFDAMKDITPIAGVAATPMVLVARSSFPARNVAELKALALKDPEKLTFGSSGNGTILHLVGMHFQELGKFKLLHVPYKGAAPIIPDLVSGTVDVAFMAYSAVDGLVKQGRLKVLGVSGPQRVPTLAGVPAIAETIPGFSLEAWFAVTGPKNLPADVVQKLNERITAIVQSDSFKNQIAAEGAVPMPMSPSALQTFMNKEYDKLGRLVRQSGASIQ